MPSLPERRKFRRPPAEGFAAKTAKFYAVLGAFLGVITTTATITLVLAAYRPLPAQMRSLEVRVDTLETNWARAARERQELRRQLDFLVCAELERRGAPQPQPCMNLPFQRFQN
jgi:hypothetical protein